MPALLAADQIALLSHPFINETVAHGCFLTLDVVLSPMALKMRLNITIGYDRVLIELPPTLHIPTVQVQNRVAVITLNTTS